MTILDSLMVSVFGLGIVFLVLVLLSFLVSLQSRIVSALVRVNGVQQESRNEAVAGIMLQSDTCMKAEEFSVGELKLYGVDEKTAAMIMAIVSDESGIPLSELQFKSIKAI